MTMKQGLWTAALIIGILYVYHVVQVKGGVSGFKSGLGIG